MDDKILPLPLFVGVLAEKSKDMREALKIRNIYKENDDNKRNVKDIYCLFVFDIQ